MPLRSFATEEEARAALAALPPLERKGTPREIKKRSGTLRRAGCLGAFMGLGLVASAVDVVGGGGDAGAVFAGAAFFIAIPATLIAATIVGGRAARTWRLGAPAVATVTAVHKAPAMLAPSQLKFRYPLPSGESREASFTSFGLEMPPPQSHILVAVDPRDPAKCVPLFDLER